MKRNRIIIRMALLLLLWLGCAFSLSAESPLSLTHRGKEVAHGSSYNIPDDNSPSSSKVALFSEQLDLFSITNSSGGALQINSLIVRPEAGMMDEEFSLTETDNLHSPLSLGNETLAKGAKRDFYIRFYPVADGERSASLEVSYTAAGAKGVLRIRVMGTGRAGAGKNPARLFTRGNLAMHKLWGGYKGSQDEMASGSVADSEGNIVFAGNGKTISSDGYYYDIFICQVKTAGSPGATGVPGAAGSLGWQKIWHSKWDDRMVVTGQNDESGGSADAVAMDDKGFVYIVGRVGNGSNTNHLALIMKIDPKDGRAVWQRLWRSDLSRLEYTDATDPYGIHVSGATVYVTGQSRYGSRQGVFVIALGTDGTLKWQKLIDTKGDGSADRGHTVKADGKGNLYIAGLEKGSALNTGLLIKLKTTEQDAALEWAKVIKIGYGSSFNSMDTDSAGNIYLSADRRGASTYFSVLKVSSEGELLAGKTFPGTGGRNNTYVVRIADGSLFAGGKIAIQGFDTSPGDGLLLRLSAADLSLEWGAMYYTGTGPNEICEHHLKGISAVGNTLYLVGQVYTGNKNNYRYWGYWYDVPGVLEDYKPDVIDFTEGTLVVDTEKGGVMDIGDARYTGGGEYEDLALSTVEFQNAPEKNERSHGSQVDGDVFSMKMDLSQTR